MPATILIRGGGDLASGVAIRLFRCGLDVVITELSTPLAVRRTVAFASAVYDEHITVEDVVGQCIRDPADLPAVLGILEQRQVPVLVDPSCSVAGVLHPLAIVDGRMTKKSPEPFEHSAPMYIGLGPGFAAPSNCDAVVETERGHSMGRAIFEGEARADTTLPEGDERRVLRAPAAGTFRSTATIGDHFGLGQKIGEVAGLPIRAPFPGILRGLLRPGIPVRDAMKIGDLDPRDDPSLCRSVSDKALAVGGGVLEALLSRAEVRGRLWA